MTKSQFFLSLVGILDVKFWFRSVYYYVLRYVLSYVSASAFCYHRQGGGVIVSDLLFTSL